jgi:hypothetical protein
MSEIIKTLEDFKKEIENPSEAFIAYVKYLATLPKPNFVKK